jgi:hypothetical protein
MSYLEKLKSFRFYLNEECNPIVSGNAIRDAEIFMRELEPNLLKQPYMSVVEDGEINFWVNYPDI